MAEMEFAFLYFLQSLHRPWLDEIMVFITSLGDHGSFFLLLACIFLLVKKTRKIGLAMLLSMLIGFLIGNVWLKNLLMRQRPCWIDPSVELLVHVPRDYSFPSGHTLIGFECGVSMWLQNRKLGIAALILAVLLAFSRMYLFVHFPTDILAGAVIGSFIAWAVYKIMEKYLQCPPDVLYFKR